MSSYVPESFQKKVNRNKQEAQDILEQRKAKRDLIKKKREEWTNKAKSYHEKENARVADRVAKDRKSVV